MFTRNSIVLSNNIKTPLTAISRAIGNILQLTYGQLVKQLFSNQEQGFAYDPNDLTTLYQDAAGTIPVTSTGQPVGLVLDKSKGLVLSDEKWEHTLTIVSGGTSILATNTYRIYSPAGSISQVSCPTGTVGKWYEISVTIDSIVSGAVTTDFGGSPVWNTVGVKKFKVYLTNTVLTFKRSGITDAQISNISVKEIAGNHAYQTVSASRPILQRNATIGAYYLAFDGVDDFLRTNNIDFTATDKVSLFAGVRKLSDAAAGALIELSSNASTISGTFGINAPDAPNSADYLIRLRGGFDNFKKITENPAPITTVISARLDAQQLTVNNKINVRLNGITSAASGYGTPSTPQNFINQPLYIGRRGGTSLPFNGHLYSLIGISRLTTDSETIALEKAIAKNTGVTLNV